MVWGKLCIWSISFVQDNMYYFIYSKLMHHVELMHFVCNFSPYPLSHFCLRSKLQQLKISPWKTCEILVTGNASTESHVKVLCHRVTWGANFKELKRVYEYLCDSCPTLVSQFWNLENNFVVSVHLIIPQTLCYVYPSMLPCCHLQ